MGRKNLSVKPKNNQKDDYTEEELEQIKADKDRIYGKVQLVLTDDKLANHINGYTKT